MKLDKITICVDMAGCPNRCKHCWIGVTKNKKMEQEDLRWVAESFREYSHKLEVTSWYREPDFRSDYKELWEIEKDLSDEHTEHFELASFWRIVRDPEYAKWLHMLGVRQCQLTLFGGEDMTDFYIGRKGAYQEIIKAIDILLEHKIAPRIQVFVNQQNIVEMGKIVELVEKLDLQERCQSIGQEFHSFVHQGSCEGGNEDLYDIRVTDNELNLLPKALIDETLEYLKRDSLEEVFGVSERIWVKQLSASGIKEKRVSSRLILYMDGEFNVYTNETAPTSMWSLGNLKVDGVEKVIYNYLNNNSRAQQIIARVPLGEMVRQCGDAESNKLFDQEDYIIYIVNQYIKLMTKEELD